MAPDQIRTLRYTFDRDAHINSRLSAGGSDLVARIVRATVGVAAVGARKSRDTLPLSTGFSFRFATVARLLGDNRPGRWETCEVVRPSREPRSNKRFMLDADESMRFPLSFAGHRVLHAGCLRPTARLMGLLKYCSLPRVKGKSFASFFLITRRTTESQLPTARVKIAQTADNQGATADGSARRINSPQAPRTPVKCRTYPPAYANSGIGLVLSPIRHQDSHGIAPRIGIDYIKGRAPPSGERRMCNYKHRLPGGGLAGPAAYD